MAGRGSRARTSSEPAVHSTASTWRPMPLGSSPTLSISRTRAAWDQERAGGGARAPPQPAAHKHPPLLHCSTAPLLHCAARATPVPIGRRGRPSGTGGVPPPPPPHDPAGPDRASPPVAAAAARPRQCGALHDTLPATPKPRASDPTRSPSGPRASAARLERRSHLLCRRSRLGDQRRPLLGVTLCGAQGATARHLCVGDADPASAPRVGAALSKHASARRRLGRPVHAAGGMKTARPGEHYHSQAPHPPHGSSRFPLISRIQSRGLGSSFSRTEEFRTRQ